LGVKWCGLWREGRLRTCHQKPATKRRQKWQQCSRIIVNYVGCGGSCWSQRKKLVANSIRRHTTSSQKRPLGLLNNNDTLFIFAARRHVASQTAWRTATPLAAVLQNSHGNGGGIFLIFVADPITVRSCTNRSRRAERSSQMVFSCMFKQQRRGPVEQGELHIVPCHCSHTASSTASSPNSPTPPKNPSRSASVSVPSFATLAALGDADAHLRLTERAQRYDRIGQPDPVLAQAG
jgi:hypothetical protein